MTATQTQRATVVGVFHDRAKAERAVAELKHMGLRDNDISVVTKATDADRQHTGSSTATGAATGAAVGAGTAALVSLGMTFGVIPIIGPILAVGPLAAALLSAAGGVAAGGLVGGLVGMGLSESEAKYYEGEVNSGRTVVTVKADGRSDEVWSILQRHGAYSHEHPATARTSQTTTGQAATGQVAADAASGRSTTHGTMAGTTTGHVAASAREQQSMKLHEEQLHAHKQPVEAGEVALRKEVVTEHKTMEVPVQREEVVIERHPVTGQTASSADLQPGKEIRIPVREEQVHVEKTPVVKEEVTVGKRTVQDTERVSGTVRKEEVRVEKQGDVDVQTKGNVKDAGTRRDKNP